MSDSDPFQPRFDDLMPNDSYESDSPMVMADLRDGIENLPEHAATFRAKHILDDHGPHAIDQQLVAMTGAWGVPDYIQNSNRTKQYVNPHYKDRHHYSDAYAECKCGAILVRESRDRGETVFNGENEHTDNCKRSWRLRARARLVERREELLREVLSYGISVRSVAPRFGLEPNSSDMSIGSIAESQHIDTQSIKQEGKQRRLNTECALLALGYTPEQVGKMWGVTASTIRGRIATKTDHDLADLRNMDYEP